MEDFKIFFSETFLKDIKEYNFEKDLEEIVNNMKNMIITIDFEDLNLMSNEKIVAFLSSTISDISDKIEINKVRSSQPSKCMLIISGDHNMNVGVIKDIICKIEMIYGELFYIIGIYINEALNGKYKIQGIFSSDMNETNYNQANDNTDISEGKRRLLYDITLFMKNNDISINDIQQKFGLGFNRTSKIINILEDLNIISAKVGTKPRKLLIDDSFKIKEIIFMAPPSKVSY